MAVCCLFSILICQLMQTDTNLDVFFFRQLLSLSVIWTFCASVFSEWWLAHVCYLRLLAFCVDADSTRKYCFNIHISTYNIAMKIQHKITEIILASRFRVHSECIRAERTHGHCFPLVILLIFGKISIEHMILLFDWERVICDAELSEPSSASIVEFNMMIMFLSATVWDLCIAGFMQAQTIMIACFIVYIPHIQVGVDISHS